MTNPRDLIQRLADALDDRLDYEETQHPDEGVMPLIAEARAYLATSEPTAGLSLKQISAWIHKCNPSRDKWLETVDHHDAIAIARAALHDLSRYYCQPPLPITLSQRLPGPEDCDGEGRCWWWDPYAIPAWVLSHKDTPGLEIWLPYYDLPLPHIPTP